MNEFLSQQDFVIPEKLIDRMNESRRLVFFTGAGVSQESGIPTFRDAQTGFWSQYKAEELATPTAFARQRDVVWGWYEYRRRMVMRCDPNPAHRAIAAIGNKFPQSTLITQNVDDLHERAGSKDVIHLHGSLFRPRCRGCAAPYEFESGIPEDPSGLWKFYPPRCERCGGWIRPGVVWFGEDLPKDAWNRATAATGECEVFICIGTSTLVYPAASLPQKALNRGACVLQINLNPTSLDTKATYNIRGKAGVILERLAAQLIDEQ